MPREPWGSGSGGLICSVSAASVGALMRPVSERNMGRGEGRIIRRREGARKVRTTERGAHKFSCASAGTAVPLRRSSVLQ